MRYIQEKTQQSCNESINECCVRSTRRSETAQESQKLRNRNRVNAQLADLAGVSTDKVFRYKEILEHGTPEEIAEVESGEAKIRPTYDKMVARYRKEMAAVSFPQVEYPFSCEDAVKSHIYKNQCGRRNISAFQKIEYAKAAFEIDIRLEAKEQQGKRTDLSKDKANNFAPNSGRSNKDTDRSGRTDRKIAELTGAGHDTIHKASKIIDFGSEKLKQEVREKKKTINEGYREIKKKKMESLIGNVPNKKYRVFYSDFFEEVDCVNGWDVIHDLSFEDLKSFPIENFREKDENAVCFLWTSLDDFYSTLKVMNAWGFG